MVIIIRILVKIFVIRTCPGVVCGLVFPGPKPSVRLKKVNLHTDLISHNSFGRGGHEEALVKSDFLMSFVLV